ncbi:restriction endonuclease subunit S [Aquabacterium sp.]|uniref:restriction endonuclease subunit S n=1 Tax=Aquabacterium sp. TaxID=1872578 RepID=UPI003D006B7D
MELSAGFKKTAIGVIPAEWEVSTLGDIGKVIRGASPRPKGDRRFYGGNVPRLMVEDVTRDGKFVYPCVDSLTEEGAKRSRPCSAGTLTVVCSGTVGIPAFLAVDACIHDGFLALIQLKSSIFPDYLFHQISNLQEKFDSSATHGGVFTNLTTTSFGAFPIAIAPLAEQRAIATALSDVDALIAGLERLIAKKRDIKQAAMQQLLTGQTRLPGFCGEWEPRPLGALGATYGGLVGKSKANFGHGSARYVPFVNVMANIRIDCGALEPVDVASTENQNRVLSGDLLFNGSSETPEEVALCALMTESVEDLYLNSFCFGFRLKQGAEASGLFLTYLMRSQMGRELMKSLAQGSTRYNLSKSALLQATLVLPGLEEQTAIATVLSDMDADLITLESRLAKTRAIKQGMMQELLTGRTRLV